MESLDEPSSEAIESKKGGPCHGAAQQVKKRHDELNVQLMSQIRRALENHQTPRENTSTVVESQMRSRETEVERRETDVALRETAMERLGTAIALRETDVALRETAMERMGTAIEHGGQESRALESKGAGLRIEIADLQSQKTQCEAEVDEKRREVREQTKCAEICKELIQQVRQGHDGNHKKAEGLEQQRKDLRKLAEELGEERRNIQEEQKNNAHTTELLLALNIKISEQIRIFFSEKQGVSQDTEVNHQSLAELLVSLGGDLPRKAEDPTEKVPEYKNCLVCGRPTKCNRNGELHKHSCANYLKKRSRAMHEEGSLS